MKDLFCSKCQQLTNHGGAVDLSGEFVFTCNECEHFIKFPADTTPETFNELAKKHEEMNVGQVSLEGQEKKLAELLNISEESQEVVVEMIEDKEANLIQ